MVRGKTNNSTEVDCMAALKKFEGLGTGTDTQCIQGSIDSFAQDLLRYLSKPTLNTKMKEDCLKRVTLILEACDEDKLALFAASNEFLSAIAASIESYKKSLSKPTSGNVITHETYHHTLVCALTLIEPTKCLRLFVKHTKQGDILIKLTTNLCELFKRDLAFFTQEMALDIICRVFIVSTKLKDMQLIKAVKESLPHSMKSHFDDINTCIGILKDMRQSINSMNIEVDNKNIDSFLVANVYISVPPNANPVTNSNSNAADQEKVLQSDCWIDMNSKAITFIQQTDTAGVFVKIPYSDMLRINYATNTNSLQVNIYMLYIFIPLYVLSTTPTTHIHNL